MKRLFSCVMIVSAIGAMALGHAADKPNVLFIAVDDMNDFVGCLDSAPQAITPNIDRLAARGVNFTNAHTPGVYCAPARTSIFTGQYASTTGIYEYQIYHALYPDLVPLQSTFQAGGYATYGMGKLFHHSEGCADLRGWTEFNVRNDIQKTTGWPMDSWSDEIPIPPQDPEVMKVRAATEKGRRMKWGALRDDQEPLMADTIRAEWAIAKLQEQHDQPFFLGVGFYAPHSPNYCPQKYWDLYDRDTIELPVYKKDDLDDVPEPMRTDRQKRAQGAFLPLIEHDLWRDGIHGYLASISYADAMIGRVLDALDNSPHANNTIVVLWSDHGYHLGEKGQWGKKLLWQRTSQVPFVWAGPKLATGATVDATVSLIDMYPTFIELCGLPHPSQQLDGQSIVTALTNPQSAQDRNVLLPDRKPNSYAIFNQEWRYIRYDNGTEELYNRQNDPHEWTNLAANPELDSVKKQLMADAPSSFASPAQSMSKNKNLILDGESFHWDVPKKN